MCKQSNLKLAAIYEKVLSRVERLKRSSTNHKMLDIFLTQHLKNLPFQGSTRATVFYDKSTFLARSLPNFYCQQADRHMNS